MLLQLLSFFTFASIEIHYDHAYRIDKEANNQEYEFNNYDYFSISYVKNIHEFELRYTTYEESSENGISRIKTTSEEFQFWYYRQFDHPIISSEGWLFSLGIGLGAYTAEVESTFGSITRTDKADEELILGAGFVNKYNFNKRFFYRNHVYLMSSAGFSQDPTLDIGFIGLGFRF